MARPRTFDRDEVLDRAVQLFWTQGYERTSVQDLVDSMGIQRGSLYAAFGDKKHLFLEALDRYEQTFRGEMERLLDGPGRAHDGIRAVFEAQHNVVGETHHDNVTARMSPSPLFGPQIEHVVQVNIPK